MAEMHVLQEQKQARFALSGSYFLESLIFPDRATHRETPGIHALRPTGQPSAVQF